MLVAVVLACFAAVVALVRTPPELIARLAAAALPGAVACVAAGLLVGLA